MANLSSTYDLDLRMDNLISIYDLDLRISAISDLLQEFYSEIYMSIDDNDPVSGVRAINNEEFKLIKNDDLIQLANWYNMAYNNFIREENYAPPKIKLHRAQEIYYATISSDDDLDGNEIAMTKKTFEQFMEIFIFQSLVFTGENVRNTYLLPAYAGGEYIKGDAY